MSDMSLTTTSFQIDYRMLTLLQKRAKELGFRSWGAYLRHMIDFHVLTFEPDLAPRTPLPLSPPHPPPPTPPRPLPALALGIHTTLPNPPLPPIHPEGH
jgi:hypothetical protein